ncbi:MAG: hypothetical protein J3K34DRAFT_261174 [Monoraphidium minutum]|nr:MAG: hypothetical protein J3K34DRAFT_261174 [Monoraphidium minutum]
MRSRVRGQPQCLAAWIALLVALSGCLCTTQAAKCGPLKLLAIGDSITKGAIPSQGRDMPYIQLAKDQLWNSLGGCFDVQASVSALGGGGIHVRNVQTVPEVALPSLRSQKWDWVAIMVGVNDLFAGGRTARDIWDGGLRYMYDEALSRGARVVGMLPLPTGLVGRCGRGGARRRGAGGRARGAASGHAPGTASEGCEGPKSS